MILQRLTDKELLRHAHFLGRRLSPLEEELLKRLEQLLKEKECFPSR